MSLPKWIEQMNHDTFRDSAEINQLLSALEIAWEVLESYSVVGQYSKADEAMRRIEELGK